jgi:predicted peroxiredoxin
MVRGKKLAILVSAAPGRPNFRHSLCLAQAARAQGAEVYLYCIAEAVRGLADPLLHRVCARGVKLFVCGYSAQRHRVAPDDRATFAGLATLSELIAAADRFVAFN